MSTVVPLAIELYAQHCERSRRVPDRLEVGLYLDFAYGGCAPTFTGYFQRLLARAPELECRIRRMVATKPLITAVDVINAMEAA